jgi:hypothetical protein
VNTSIFETLNKADNTAIKQYIEWHKTQSKAHHNVVINQAYDYNAANQLVYRSAFLAGIPLQEDSAYRIAQIKKKPIASMHFFSIIGL